MSASPLSASFRLCRCPGNSVQGPPAERQRRRYTKIKARREAVTPLAIDGPALAQLYRKSEPPVPSPDRLEFVAMMMSQAFKDYLRRGERDHDDHCRLIELGQVGRRCGTILDRRG